MKSTRFHPNIIITGTPGCGKTSHAEALVSQLKEPFKHYNISELAKERRCFESYDEEFDSHVVDEDKLLDLLEPDLREGGGIVDWHCCDIFPERLINLVVVLKTDTHSLHERLTKRGYKDNKIQENIDCEIMEVVWQDAAGAYIPEIVIPLVSNTVEDMEDNVERIATWIENWKKDHPQGVTNELDPSVVSEDESGESGESDENDEDSESA